LAQNWLKLAQIGSKKWIIGSNWLRFKILLTFGPMKEKVYNFDLQLNWRLLNTISQIDRFDASWAYIEKTEGDNLKYLKTIATIQSVGASTRIEGSKMSDAEVEELMGNIGIAKIVDRDSQEVVGYFNVLDLITEVFDDIDITINGLKNLHNILLKHSEKDDWHKGGFKKHSNAVQANFPDGTNRIIFMTTEPGFATDDAMRVLVNWYNQEKSVHPLIKGATFVYEFLSIHPFQDGNGRLSRLLTTLFLLKSGYTWIQYVSFEHEIERNKKDYYRVLRSCQAQRPNEDITEWIDFFLESLINVQFKLQQKLLSTELTNELSPKDKSIYLYVNEHPKCQSKDIAASLGLSKATVKRILTELLAKKLIQQHGKGAGVYYMVR
jgi:Fic family protein